MSNIISVGRQGEEPVLGRGSLHKKTFSKRPWWFWCILGLAILVIAFGSYGGFTFAQANGLAREADELAKSGKFSEAVAKYDRATKKWPWLKVKLSSREENVKALAAEDKNYKDGEASFGNGEWQKCIDYLSQVTNKYPNYKASEERYSDCQKKLAAEQEEAANAAAAAAAAAAAQAETNNNSSTASASSTNGNRNSSAGRAAASSGSATGQTGSAGSGQPSTLQNIFGDISATNIESVVNALPLVYGDGAGDFVTPPGGAPPSGVYAYSPIDISGLYMGAHNGRLYIKWALAGTISSTQESANGNTIEMIVFNTRLAVTPDESAPCGGRTAFFQGNISYKDNGQIFYNTMSKAVCNNTGPYGSQDDWGFANSGSGLAHTFNSGLGKNSLVYSFALSDLGINVGDSLKVELWSEAESNLWHHYSTDNASSDWIDWTVQGV